jgi:hypothetical protein
MELLLNLTWLAVATAGFIFAPKHSGRVWLVLACVAALLFPIISVSDDFNADRTFNVDAAALVVTLVLFAGLVTIARIRTTQSVAYAVHIATLSDPRSPPAP